MSARLRTIRLGLCVGAVLLVGVLQPAVGEASVRCGNINFNTGNIRATNVGCATARRVARRWNGCRRCRVGGWSYRTSSCGHECARIVARRGRRVVTFGSGA